MVSTEREPIIVPSWSKETHCKICGQALIYRDEINTIRKLSHVEGRCLDCILRRAEESAHAVNTISLMYCIQHGIPYEDPS